MMCSIDLGLEKQLPVLIQSILCSRLGKDDRLLRDYSVEVRMKTSGLS